MTKGWVEKHGRPGGECEEGGGADASALFARHGMEGGRSKVMAELAQRRSKLVDELNQAERGIHELEGRYLQESPAQANVLKGFDNFAQQARNASSAPPQRRRTPLRAEERLFSLSSATSPVVRLLATLQCRPAAHSPPLLTPSPLFLCPLRTSKLARSTRMLASRLSSSIHKLAMANSRQRNASTWMIVSPALLQHAFRCATAV
jgi:hypothetical protein